MASHEGEIEPAAIEAVEIVKRFGNLVANDRVSLAARRCEILALVGENGAGKSTLMNILSGLLQPDSGQIRLNGIVSRFGSPREAIERGVGMVHQHFMLIPKLTVAENVVLGHEPSKVLFDKGAARRKVATLSESYGLKLQPEARVEALSVGLQQRVEILKVLYWGSDILIFDEPTAVLTPQETAELFVVLRDLAAQGRTIIFITHKLREVMSISDRVTVLRAGKVVGNMLTVETTPAEIASRMIGRELVPHVRTSSPVVGAAVLKVKELSVLSDRGPAAVTDFNLEVRRGEIVGIAGVEGNGQTEMVEALTGLRTAASGSATVNGEELLNGNATSSGWTSRGGKLAVMPGPRRVRSAGVGYVPEDRRERGLVLPFTVANNLILGAQTSGTFARAGLLRFGRIRAFARGLIGQFDVRPARADVPAGNLSGGNQQKVVLAREFSADPAVLIAAQPTRGLDVGAAQFIHGRLVEKRDAGAAILLVSAELEEIMALSDRIAVMYEGRIMKIFQAGEASEEQIGLLMTGGEVRTAAQTIDLNAPALAPGT